MHIKLSAEVCSDNLLLQLKVGNFPVAWEPNKRTKIGDEQFWA